MTEIQVGKVMLTPKGEYDNTKTYIRLDAVTYQGSSYVCLSDTSSAPPGDSWQLLADKGADGQPGKDGQPGSPGVTPHIDATTGNWFIGTTNTGVKAQGPAGQNGSDGKPGSNGSDGVSPHIDSTTGHWFVGSTDTGVSARGPQGQQGSPGKDGVTPDVSNLATKTDLANYYTKTETDTKLSTKADQAEYQALNDKFNNMQIGGRNLLRGTATFEFPFVSNEGTHTIQKYDDETNYLQHTSNTPLSAMGPWWSLTPKVGQVYTLSADVCGNGYIAAGMFHYEGGEAGSLGRVDLTNGWQRISNTFRVNKISGNWIIYASNSTLLKIKDIKIEKGNVATDWTPAPEDTITAIQKNTTAIGQANKQITDLQTAVKAQQSAAIDTSNVSTSKKPSDYSDGFSYEIKSFDSLGIDKSKIASELVQGKVVWLTTKKYSTYARQTAEVIDGTVPATFVRNGEDSTWHDWLISQLTAF